MTNRVEYSFTATVWQHSPPGGWYFVTVPQEISNEIREHFRDFEEGWGRLSVMAETGNAAWNTAIWFDTSHNKYLLPLKSEIRKKEKLGINQEIQIKILI